jgi:monofunctional glycosyltransferase
VKEQETGVRSRGASTISQQTAKNLFLWGGRSYVRKGLEAWFTMLLELCWPKTRILEVYLNSAQFGPDVYGVEAAAQSYFHKHASALTRSEAAQLAAVLPNPVRLRADRPSAYVTSRREWILGQMRGLGEATFLRNL